MLEYSPTRHDITTEPNKTIFKQAEKVATHVQA